jgi:hypothetical protein
MSVKILVDYSYMGSPTESLGVQMIYVNQVLVYGKGFSLPGESANTVK